MTTRPSPSVHKLWAATTALFAILVLFLTLRPDSTLNTANFVPFREHGAAWTCVLSQCSGAAASAEFLITDVLGNIVVFFPIGFAAAGAFSERSNGKRILLAIGGGLLLSLFIETVQFGIATRATDVDDLIFNTIGAAFGAGAFVAMQWRAD